MRFNLNGYNHLLALLRQTKVNFALFNVSMIVLCSSLSNKTLLKLKFKFRVVSLMFVNVQYLNNLMMIL
jgi:hypothetical protein